MSNPTLPPALSQCDAFAVGAARVQLAHATGLAMLNEVSAQQNARVIEQASVVAALKGLLRAPPALPPKEGCDG